MRYVKVCNRWALYTRITICILYINDFIFLKSKILKKNESQNSKHVPRIGASRLPCPQKCHGVQVMRATRIRMSGSATMCRSTCPRVTYIKDSTSSNGQHVAHPFNLFCYFSPKRMIWNYFTKRKQRITFVHYLSTKIYLRLMEQQEVHVFA